MSLGIRPGKQPSTAAAGSKGNKPSSLHLVPRALRKKNRKGPRGAHSLGAIGIPSQTSGATPGSATNLPSQETCHPPTGQTAACPKPLLRLQPAGRTCSSSRDRPPSWLLPLRPLTFPSRRQRHPLLFPVLLPSLLLNPACSTFPSSEKSTGVSPLLHAVGCLTPPPSHPQHAGFPAQAHLCTNDLSR